ncbi:hypothetical protein ACUNG5_23870, partial [Serratia sp. IR-2025]
MAMERVRAGWRCFSHAFDKECRVAFRSPVVHWLSWIFPLILFGLISSNFSEGTLLDLPVSVVDSDHSPLSKSRSPPRGARGPPPRAATRRRGPGWRGP